MMTSIREQFLPAKAVLSAILIAISLGLLFEGVMIGPEYQRYKPPYLVLVVLCIFAVFLAWLWWKERNAGENR